MYRRESEKALKIADEIIKNTYRTLMTRGTKGCYIYCEDKALAEHIKIRIMNMDRTFRYDEPGEESLGEVLKVAESDEEVKYE